MTRSSSASRARRLAWVLPALVAACIAAGLVAQAGSANIEVKDGSTTINPADMVAFGSTAPGTAVTKTFTVRNSGTGNLLVSEAISVPPGFTLMASFPGVPNANFTPTSPAYTIAPGTTATFIVALNSAMPGSFSGTVSFATNVTDKNPFRFQLTGSVTGSTDAAGPSVRTIDDGSPDFTVTSGWFSDYSQVGGSGKRPFNGYLSWARPGTGTEAATYTFTGLAPGQYTVAATWVGYPWGATNTPYTVFNGTTALGTVRVNQKVDATGFVDGGSVWQNLGTFTITGPTLVVKLSDDANSFLNADGVRVERIGYSGAIVDDNSAEFSVTGSWASGYTEPGARNFQFTSSWSSPAAVGAPTATARWTFRVTPGTYRVSVGYHPYAWSATNAPYRVFDNSTNLTPTPIRIDQTVAPTDLLDAGIGWKDLGVFKVMGTQLVVQLANDADSWANADAARVERVGGEAGGPTMPSDADSVRLLYQTTWGPTPALITRVKNLGFNVWLNQQFAADETSYPLLPLYRTSDNFTNDRTTSCFSPSMPTADETAARQACLRDHYTLYPLQNRFFSNALYGEDQLRQRVAWALHKIWVISGLDIPQPAWVTPYLRILSANAFGNYRTLMYQITLNPAMGNYLDMAGSNRNNPNENYPRELLQLFTIGLNELNPDGTNKTAGTPPAPIPTYDQALINSITKVFTGWNFAPPPMTGIPNYIDPMRLGGAATENPANHDVTAKQLLRGFVQPARPRSVANAYLDLNECLDNIYAHPSLAPFICKQLIQQLVTSTPSPAYVARVVDVFNRNKTSPTQLREVVRAILLDPEARGDSKPADNYGHLKEPVLLVTNLMRMFDARSADRTQNSDGYLNPDAINQGQDTFRPPSVFSYFPPGRVVNPGPPPVLGPEFGILTTSTALRRINFVNQCFAPSSGRTIDLVRNRGTAPNGTYPTGYPQTGQPIAPTGPLGTAVSVSFLTPLAGNPSALADELNRLMLHGTMTAEMKAEIVTAVSAVAASNVNKRARTAVYLVATSSQYQVQK